MEEEHRHEWRRWSDRGSEEWGGEGRGEVEEWGGEGEEGRGGEMMVGKGRSSP